MSVFLCKGAVLENEVGLTFLIPYLLKRYYIIFYAQSLEKKYFSNDNHYFMVWVLTHWWVFHRFQSTKSIWYGRACFRINILLMARVWGLKLITDPDSKTKSRSKSPLDSFSFYRVCCLFMLPTIDFCKMKLFSLVWRQPQYSFSRSCRQKFSGFCWWGCRD